MEERVFQILHQMTSVKRLEVDGSRVVAAVHPGDKSIGTLSQPVGTSSVLQAGADWLAAQGCTRVWGPMEGCSWFGYRANLGPHVRPPFAMEPQASSDPWLAHGYREVAHYTSTLHPHEGVLAGLEQHRLRAAEGGFHVRNLNASARDAELLACHAITMKAFANAVGFVPIPGPLFVAMYAPLVSQTLEDLVLVAEDKAGVIVGYCFCFPEPNAPQRKEMVVKSLAVSPAVGGAGLGSALVAEAHARAQGLGLTGGGIHALMWSSSHSQSITAHGDSEVFRHYALFEREL